MNEKLKPPSYGVTFRNLNWGTEECHEEPNYEKSSLRAGIWSRYFPTTRQSLYKDPVTIWVSTLSWKRLQTTRPVLAYKRSVLFFEITGTKGRAMTINYTKKFFSFHRLINYNLWPNFGRHHCWPQFLLLQSTSISTYVKVNTFQCCIS
jgi:hypothetical protein